MEPASDPVVGSDSYPPEGGTLVYLFGTVMMYIDKKRGTMDDTPSRGIGGDIL